MDFNAGIRKTVRERFSRLALSPESERKFPIGPESAKRLGYAPAWIDQLPASATESFAGVGNPFLLGEIAVDAVVLDLGCGAGLDSLFAAQRVTKGRVVGVDMTEEMVSKASKNAEVVGVGNVEFHCAQAKELPLENDSIDVIISNGVFNLCVDKPEVANEMHRVLRSNGRLFAADMLVEEGVTAETVNQMGEWSD